MSQVEWGVSRNSVEEESGTMEGLRSPTDWVMFEMVRWDPGGSRGIAEAGALVPVVQGMGGWGEREGRTYLSCNWKERNVIFQGE